MALKFQNVPVVFNGGVDATDPFLVSPNKQTSLVNAVFDNAQTISQRAGLFLLSLAPKIPTVPAPYARTNPSFTGIPYRMSQRLGSLLLEGASGLFSRSAYNGGSGSADGPTVLQARTDSGTSGGGRTDFARAHVDTSFVGGIDNQVSVFTAAQYDMGRIENYDGLGRVMTLHAWIDYTAVAGSSLPTLHVRAFDEGISTLKPAEVSRTQILDLNIPSASGALVIQNPRVVTTATDFYVLAQVGSAPGSLTIPIRLTASTGVVSYPTYTAAFFNAASGFDVIQDPSDGQLVLAYQNGATSLRVEKLNAAASAVSVGNSFATAATLQAISLVLTRVGGTYRYTALYTSPGAASSTIFGVWLTGGGATLASTTVATTAGALRTWRFTGIDYGDNTSSTFTLWYDMNPGFVAANSQAVYQVLVTKTTLAGSACGCLARGAHIFGRPAISNTNIVQVPCCSYAFDTKYPSIYLIQAVADGTGYVALPNTPLNQTVITARVHWGAAGDLLQTIGLSAAARLPSTFSTSTTPGPSNQIVFPVTRWSAQSTATGGGIYALTQLWVATASLATQDIGYAESNRLTLLAGSCPQVFDGDYFSESGFSLRPVITSAARSAGGGSLSAGTYTFYATYLQLDEAGNVRESMPSDPVVLSGVLAADQVTISVTDPMLTEKQNIQTRIYHTIANGSTAYYDQNVIPNALSGGSSDTSLESSSLLPTTGDILPNQPAPACRVLVEHDKRLWAIGGETGDIVYFSQPISQDIEPEWNRLLFRRVPRNCGRVVSAVSLDDKLIFFCEKRIGFIYGNGPTRSGAQDGYSEFVEAVSGYAISWDEPHSVVRSSDGVWFRCGFGFRLLGRNMQVVQDDGNDLASEIDSAILNLKVIRTVIGETAQQVRFHMSDNSIWVFDLVYRQWSLFTSTRYSGMVDAANLGEAFYIITYNATTPTLYVENGLSTSDAGVTIVSSLRTGWLAFAGLQAFQRVSRIQLLAKLSSLPSNQTAIFGATAYYNYEEETSEVLLAPLEVSCSQTNFKVQFELQPGYQKCESVQYVILFYDNYNETRVSLTALNLTVGLKKGRFKLPNTQKLG